METLTRRIRITRRNDAEQSTGMGLGESLRCPGTNPSEIIAPKSCVRCRQFKKRCNRNFPACSRCQELGQICSFSNPESSITASAHHLRARLKWLSAYFNERLMRSPAKIEHVETGTDLDAFVTSRSETAVIAPSLILDGDTAHIKLSSAVECQGLSSSPVHSGLPPDAAARRFVDAYFRHVNRAYPFLSRPEVLSQLELFEYHAERHKAPESTRLYLIMAIG